MIGIMQIFMKKKIETNTMETDERITKLENLLEEIWRMCKDNMPPYYAYGDNEAACYMADLIESIQEKASNLP